MNALETYLSRLSDIRGRGVSETASYGTLEAYLNDIGKALKPKVTCIINIKNRGAGIPDGGFFTQDQIRKEKPQEGDIIQTAPARGVMEVKGVSDDVRRVAKSEQVRKYLAMYGQVLVTTYREFILVVKGDNGQPVNLESYSLGESEEAFWQLCAHPRKAAQEHGERLSEFLKRAMLRNAVLDDPEELAWFLASYARDALAAIESTDLPALSSVREGLEEALGIQFEGERGLHFFRSTLIQTLFYGVFSAWVLWSEKHPRPKERFDWRMATWTLKVPMIRTLFELTAQPSKLGPLGLDKLLDLVADTLSRVDRPSFFEKFNQEQAVQYFYEPFLEAFDPVLRKELGVWYTPHEVVQYMVARVDTALKEELGIEDGLADKRVRVLDPCCGTGAFLVEVLKHIREALKTKDGDALSANDLREAALYRVFGFEILPAPFVISHMQLGLLLQRSGAPLSEDGSERAAVYLTNALSHWTEGEQLEEKYKKIDFRIPEMKPEFLSAYTIKNITPIWVILGNPPYNAFSGVAPTTTERKDIEDYKLGLQGEWGIKKFNLDDPYIRFFRVAEHRIAEKSRKGIVCYISNFSYLGDPSFVVMRKHLLANFDRLWFDCLNGDSRETGKLTPEGKPDPSVFSTEQNKEGIRVGTAIGLMVRKEKRDEAPTVRFRHFWGASKRADLLESLKAKRFNATYDTPAPEASNRFSFKPMSASSDYLKWPRVVDLCAITPISGLQEMRGGAMMDIDKSTLERRMKAYFDPKLEWETYKPLGYGLTEKAGGFVPKPAREKLLKAEKFDPTRIEKYALRPFETLWCYYTTVTPIWNRPRPEIKEQAWEGNRFIITRMLAERPHENICITITRHLPDYHLLRPNAIAIPIHVRHGGSDNSSSAQGKLALGGQLQANLSESARRYLTELGLKNPDTDPNVAEALWMHVLAIGFSSEYLEENRDGVQQDFPRIPLPNAKKRLLASAALGLQVAALLDTESPVPGVTAGTIRPELKLLGGTAKTDGKPVQPNSGDLKITAGWGHSSQGSVVMPGKGKAVERDYTPEERKAIKDGAKALKLTEEEALRCLGERALDVYLNGEVYWSGVPQRVYDYTIGGYQVIKKWLSYREESILGRALTPDEARYITEVVRRLAALLLLEPGLNGNYREVNEKALAR
ncbi:MAG: DNA methyltransferase [Myxococcales bacterium]|nr:MAG: DNA methyltransferase [Myxococcales bacterium]